LVKSWSRWTSTRRRWGLRRCIRFLNVKIHGMCRVFRVGRIITVGGTPWVGRGAVREIELCGRTQVAFLNECVGRHRDGLSPKDKFPPVRNRTCGFCVLSCRTPGISLYELSYMCSHRLDLPPVVSTTGNRCYCWLDRTGLQSERLQESTC
jgi:hypothetical protein